MRYLWLVGWREFMENARTKGFWLGIFLFPVIIFVKFTVNVTVLSQTMHVSAFIAVLFPTCK